MSKQVEYAKRERPGGRTSYLGRYWHSLSRGNMALFNMRVLVQFSAAVTQIRANEMKTAVSSNTFYCKDYSLTAIDRFPPIPTHDRTRRCPMGDRYSKTEPPLWHPLQSLCKGFYYISKNETINSKKDKQKNSQVLAKDGCNLSTNVTTKERKTKIKKSEQRCSKKDQ